MENNNTFYTHYSLTDDEIREFGKQKKREKSSPGQAGKPDKRQEKAASGVSSEEVGEKRGGMGAKIAAAAAAVALIGGGAFGVSRLLGSGDGTDSAADTSTAEPASGEQYDYGDYGESSAASKTIDKSWAYRSADITLTPGIYIYALFNGYYAACNLVENAEKSSDILSERIAFTDDNGIERSMTAEEYAKDYADKEARRAVAVDDIFTKNSLEVDSDDALTEYMEAQFPEIWEINKDVMESYGISEEEMHYCLVEYEGKKTAVFNFIYGPNGEKAVSDEELTQYLTDKTDCYAYIPFCKDDIMKLMTAEGTTLDSDSEEYSQEVDKRFIEAKTTFQGYADGINSGKKTYDDVLNDYLLEFSPSIYADPTQSGVLNKNTETLAGEEELPACIRRLSTGKAELIETGEGDTAMYYLVYKPALSEFGDYLSDHQTQNTAGAVIPGNAKASFNTGYTRATLLNEMKSDDFDQYLTDYSKSINVEKNIDLIATYSPQMFVDYEKEHPSDTDEVG